MSTKNNPGPYDCYARLAEDEPYFLLRAKDPIAPALVRLWAAHREVQFGPYVKIAEARVVAPWRNGGRSIQKRSRQYPPSVKRSSKPFGSPMTGIYGEK